MAKNTLTYNQDDARQHPQRNRKSPTRFDDKKLTVKNILCINNSSSTISVLTVK